jgi:hypothetical protein
MLMNPFIKEIDWSLRLKIATVSRLSLSLYLAIFVRLFFCLSPL